MKKQTPHHEARVELICAAGSGVRGPVDGLVKVIARRGTRKVGSLEIRGGGVTWRDREKGKRYYFDWSRLKVRLKLPVPRGGGTYARHK